VTPEQRTSTDIGILYIVELENCVLKFDSNNRISHFLAEVITQMKQHGFNALHGMQTRSSDENSVCPSVKRVICDKTKESCTRILIPHEIPFTLVL